MFFILQMVASICAFLLIFRFFMKKIVSEANKIAQKRKNQKNQNQADKVRSEIRYQLRIRKQIKSRLRTLRTVAMMFQEKHKILYKLIRVEKLELKWINKQITQFKKQVYG